MNRRTALLTVFALFATVFPGAFVSAAAAKPLYDVKATWGNTNLGAPDSEGKHEHEGQLEIQARNLSAETGTEALTIEDRLPAGVTVKAIRWQEVSILVPGTCSGANTETVSCELPAAQLAAYAPGRGELVGSGWASVFPSGYLPTIEVVVKVPVGASGSAPNRAILYGGSGALPGGSPCAQSAAQLASLPPCAEDEDQVPLSTTPAPFGLVPGGLLADFFDRQYPEGEPSRKAGDHPFELRFDFDLAARTTPGLKWTKVVSVAPLKTVEATLPRGAIGNPEALPKCDPVKFAEAGAIGNSTACPANTQVGYINVPFSGNGTDATGFLIPNATVSRVPIYSLTPPKGQVADFAFSAAGLIQAHLYPVLDPAQGYAVKTVVPDITALQVPRGSEVTFWGVPADPAHDWARFYPTPQPGNVAAGAPFEGTIRPLLTNPMDCKTESGTTEENGGAKFRADSYAHPGEFTPTVEYGTPDNVEECEDPRFRFEPKVALAPTDQHAGAPTGLDVHLKVPQREEEIEVKNAKELYAEEGYVAGIATPPIKKAIVTFPEGMTLSPSAAQGLTGCSLAQVGIEQREGKFVPNDNPVRCPDSSQYGKLVIHTPDLPLDAQPEGHIYIARQNENPFGSFLALYLVIEEPERGLLFKIPGEIKLDEKTGQITTTFDELPQWPVSDLQMSIKSGVRAGLVEPQTCGPKTITAEFFTWQDPTTPHTVNAHYEVTEKPDGSPCLSSLAQRPFAPSLSAGTLNPIAADYSPFALRLTRTDEDQEFSQLGVTLPMGLAAKFAGVGICPEQGIAQALARERIAGDGALEQAEPSCPESSQIGTTTVGAGVGVPLSWVPGKVYLAGPYKGAPISVVVISPAIVGPYDLGVITVRTALKVNPETAQGEALSDPFPQIFQGIPLRIRDIRLSLNRPGFTLNPTSCAEKQIEAQITGTGGDLASTADDSTASLANRFQAADCASLGFHPSLAFHLKGGTKRGAHPRLKAVVRMPSGGANIARAQVALPRSEFLDQGHIRTVCTRVQFAAHECPAASIYGFARAKTPLFEAPLEGPVYLRSSSHLLPDLLAALKGPASQPVEVDLDGRIDSINEGIRNSFELVPDAPVETFTLEMQGGRKGLLVNSTNLCAHVNRATAKFTAQNGRALTLHPALRSACAKAHRRAHKHGHR